MKRGLETTADGIVIIRVHDLPRLCGALVKTRSLDGARVVLLDCTGALEPGPDDGMLDRVIKAFPVPVVAAMDGEIKGWLLAVVSGSHICFAGNSSVLVEESDCITDTAKKGCGKLSVVEAIRNGLINQNAPQKNALESAILTAEKISSMAPLAVRACLRSVNKAEKSGIDEGIANEAVLFSQLFESQDMRRGTSAFLDKRKPRFEGN